MKNYGTNGQRIAVVIILLLLFQSVSGLLLAQTGRLVPINPFIKIHNQKTLENPMRLDILNVDIKIMGKIAVTTLDMTFYNGNSRTLEGEFNFPLGEGLAVSRFALDMNGVLREGVVVEKEKGRKTFESIVRRGVDPGLLEMTEGNNFRMRIFPLPAKGTRRVVLAFEQELTDKGASDLYILPLKISEAVKKFSLHAEIIKNNVELDNENNELSNLSFKKWNDSYVADLEQADFTPDKNIALSMPHVANPVSVFTAEKSTDSSYFYINIQPKPMDKAKVLPKKLTLLWDHSNSAQNRNVKKELDLLDAYLKKIGNLSIDLVPFNFKIGQIQTFQIVNGNSDSLKLALNAMIYDGGTALGCLDFTKFSSDEILLFSDGMSTFGSSEPILSKTPVYAIHSNATANPSMLTYLSQKSGGRSINLNQFTTGEALKMLSISNYHFISAEIIEGKVSNLYPSMPCTFDHTFNLVGILTGKLATVKLNFGFGTTVSYSTTIQFEVNNEADKAILRRFWAEKKISELSLNEKKNSHEILQTGKEFGIVTPNTSLIVLENLTDYLQNDIVPPLDMQAEFFKRRNLNEKKDSLEEKTHLESVVKLSHEQSKWWNTNYPILPKKQVKGKNTIISVTDVVGADETKGQEDQGVDIADLSNHKVVIEEPSTHGLRETSTSISVTVRDEEPADENENSTGEIQLDAWDPQTPYYKVLQYAIKGTEYQTYLKLKKEYGTTPSFYLDAADFFSKEGKIDTAVIILSNLAELTLESPQLLRILGYKLSDLKKRTEAVFILEEVLRLKGEEPQSYRDLGLAYQANGNYQKALKTLYEVVKKDWDNRFPRIELIVMNEINALIAAHPDLNVSFIDKRLLKKEPVNIRVCLTWDTDNCDMDLWVTDPTGEKCKYSNILTRLGGKISKDFMNGYGPEEFMIKKAVNGAYLVEANYYGNDSQTMLAPVNLHLVFFTNYGKPSQKRQEITIRLEKQSDVIHVGTFKFTNK